MSEAELHILRAGLFGGQLAKASPGELGNEVARRARLCGDTSGSPRPRCPGPGRGAHLLRGLPADSLRSRLGELVNSRALRLLKLKNPRYAGAFAYGRRQTLKN